MASEKADDVFVRQFLVILGTLVIFMVSMILLANTIGSNVFQEVSNKPDAVHSRLQPASFMCMSSMEDCEQGKQMSMAEKPADMVVAEADPNATAPASEANENSPEKSYMTYCVACHGQSGNGGLPTAPTIGEAADWAPRVAVGIDNLVQSAIAGKGAMPPRGASPLNDEQIAAVINYILENSK